MSKWASRWPGEYAFKDGPSRRGPDRQHKSTIKPTVALVDTKHKADDVERRYREIRLRQKEQERQRRRSFVMEAQAPPRPPSPVKPRLPPGHGREPAALELEPWPPQRQRASASSSRRWQRYASLRAGGRTCAVVRWASESRQESRQQQQQQQQQPE